ncbi:pyrimidine-nucleoside phosphorylase, partial [Clostridium botulinum]|nr:pyrimidine-nucleoside phosphorylase [Clostridium botulinum]
AAGANAIILDVKVGEGAFMKTPETAKELAEEMVNIGKSVGRNTVAILSDMDQPLGYAIGNALEVKEAIDTLKGKGPKDLLELCLTLGSNMVILSQKANTIEEARKMLLSTIEKGLAIEKLKEFIRSQGGDDTLVDNTEKLPKAEYIIPVICDRNGYINKIHAQNIGIIASELGAGRVTKDSIIDLAVGIVLNKKRSDKVKKGDIIAYIHANDKIKEEKAAKDILNNYVIEEELKEELPLIYDTVK